MVFLAPAAAPVLTLWLLSSVTPQPSLGGHTSPASEPQQSDPHQAAPFCCQLHECLPMQLRFRVAVPACPGQPRMHVGWLPSQGLRELEIGSPCLSVKEWLRRPRGEREPRRRPRQRQRRQGRRAPVIAPPPRSPQGSRSQRLSHPRDRRQGLLPPVRSAGQQNAAGPRRRGQRQVRNMGPRLPPRRRRQHLLGCLLFLHHHLQSCFRHHLWLTPPQPNTSVPWLHRGGQDHHRRPQPYLQHRECQLQPWPLHRRPHRLRHREPGPQHRQWSRPDLRLLMGRSQVGASLYASSPSSLLLDLQDPDLLETGKPHSGPSSSLAWALLLGYRADSRARANVCDCQKDLPLLTLFAPHVDSYDLAQPVSPHWPWIRAHSGRACSGWKQPAVFCSALTPALPPVLALPTALHTGPCAGLRSVLTCCSRGLTVACALAHRIRWTTSLGPAGRYRLAFSKTRRALHLAGIVMAAGSLYVLTPSNDLQLHLCLERVLPAALFPQGSSSPG